MGPGDIAIVGMAGLYPQADDIDVFWSNILNKVDAITESSDAWVGDDSIHDPDSAEIHQIYTRRGGFLGDLSRFDARSFGTMPNSLEGAQPDQFLALKLAHDALTDAGYAPGNFDSHATGVILGHAIHANRANTNAIQQVWFHAQIPHLLRALFPDLTDDRMADALAILKQKMPSVALDSVPGLVPNILTGRIANRLDLMGPNYIIDAACSSSLIAIDQAISELNAGRADMMLAGGINTTTSPLVYSVFCSVGALSHSGQIRPFGSSADGTILGEGGGIVVLKRFADALEADDRIYAVIKGVGQSSDGKSSGLMAPRLEGEVLAMERTYRQTRIDPATIGLIEAHGTGIPLGDKTEVDALRAIFGERKGDVPTLPMGSIKSMIGHCIPASGSAAVIKMALALNRKIVPPTLCDAVHSGIGLDSTPFYLETEARPWLHGASYPRRAAINAFGFGGINAHMVLEEPPADRSPDPTAAFSLSIPATTELGQVFVFTAADRSSLLGRIEAAERMISEDPSTDIHALARDQWHATDNAPDTERLAIVCTDTADLLKKLGNAAKRLANREHSSLQTRNGIYFEAKRMEGKVALLFPGEMAQYPGMMRDVAMAYPWVREWFDFICAIFEGERDVRLQDVLFPPTTVLDEAGAAKLDALLHQVDYGSELVFAADQATYQILTALGVKADAMLGHSTGENAALVASGCLSMSRDDVGAMIHRMNRVFASIEESGAVPKGVLLTIAALDRQRLLSLLDEHPDVSFTMDNCPNQAILFGDAASIDTMQKKAVADGAICTRLPISWGYHTPHVRPMAEGFDKLFASVPLRNCDVVLYSCATAEPFPMKRDAFAEVVGVQYTSRVRMVDAVERLYADGCRIFIECGPSATLTSFVGDILGDRQHLAVSTDNTRRGMLANLRHVVARLFTAGVPLEVDWLLFADEHEDAVRRRAAREAHRNSPSLPSELVFNQYDEDEAQALRAAIDKPLRQRAPSGAANPGEEPASWHAKPGRPATGPAVSRHLTLMRDFLSGYGSVIEASADHVSRPMRSSGPIGADHRPLARKSVSVLDLTGAFDLPFDFRAYLMRGAPSLDSVARYLSDRERAEADEVAARFRSGDGWFEWALSRLAVKRAAATLLARQSGVSPVESVMEILKRDSGAPFIEVNGSRDRTPNISIAHAVSAGVGAACDARWRLGIDFDAPRRVRDPDEFLQSVLSASEQQKVAGPNDASLATTVWCLKEASAKALGKGIAGEPRRYIISDYDPGSGMAKLQCDDETVSAVARKVGEGICTVAYAPTHA